MDTITHGIAGALIGKAVFWGDDMFASRPINRGRILTWSLMLGAIFPDSDVLRDIFSHDKLLIVTWHRSITHSLILLPLWALLLAWITRWFAMSKEWRLPFVVSRIRIRGFAILTGAINRWLAKKQEWPSPTLAELTGIYAVGILSHILLDLVTTFGTMIWSPLEWSRPAWDMIFIVDFTLSGVLLAPQLLAWIYSQQEKMWPRALRTWLVFLIASLVISRIAEGAGAPISARTVLGVMVVITVIFMLPALRGWGLKVKYASWNRAGFAATLMYIAMTFFSHRAALARIEKFEALDHLQVESIGALPLPPSLWHWDGLVRTERGVYELRMDLSDKSANETQLLMQEHRYFPDAPPNSYIEAARHLPEVQKVLWFARFPVTRFHKEGEESVVEISDLRFARMMSSRPAAFTYRVRFDATGNVVSQGWAAQ
jgi:membrane-bound metal-dependent hydrolase YbcI (DUF457 family)